MIANKRESMSKECVNDDDRNIVSPWMEGIDDANKEKWLKNHESNDNDDDDNIDKKKKQNEKPRYKTRHYKNAKLTVFVDV